jgi:hypothetical protein
LIRGEIVDDEVDDLVQVVVHEALALAGNRGGHLIAKSLQNVPKGNIKQLLTKIILVFLILSANEMQQNKNEKVLN